MDQLNWSLVERDVRGWMVRFLGTLVKRVAHFPIQTPLNQFTCLSVEERKVNVSSVWIYDLLKRTDSSFWDGKFLKKELPDVLLLELEENIQTSLKIVRTLYGAYYSHFGLSNGAESDVHKDLVSSVVMYIPLSYEDQQFIPFLKYQLSYLFAVCMKQSELPEKYVSAHKAGHVLSGSLGRLFKLRGFGGKLRNLEWLNTVLHGIKKGLPQMGAKLLEQALKKHSDRLSNLETTPEPMLEQIERTAREVFPKKVLFEDYCDVSKYVSISRNACFENTRTLFGPIGLAYKRWLGASSDRDEQLSYWRHHLDLEMDRILYFPRLNSQVEILTPFPFLSEQLPMDRSLALNSLDDGIACDYLSEGFARLDERLTYKGKASVKAIFEPLKVRLITAGDYLSNGIWGSLQKTLWRKMQSFPQLSLTGRAVELADLYSIETNSCFHTQFNLWVSGDYSAATDNMKMDSTLAAIGAISGDPMTKSILIKGLSGNVVTYEAIAQDGVNVPSDFVMKRGQLMGCVFSFVFLCIVNLAVYRHSLETRTGQKLFIRDCPVRVNGDDILFKADTELLSLWESNIKQVGFEKSIGKNYVSEDFAIINSTLFDVKNIDNYRSIPYLNMGWVNGTQKGGGTMRMNRERTKTLEDDIRRIRPQMEQTKEDWFENCECGSNQIERRLGVYNRYRSTVLAENLEEIKKYHLPTDSAVGGLGLTDELTTCPYVNGFRLFMCTNDRKRSVCDIPIDNICPEILGPWKLPMLEMTKTSLNELHDEYRSSSKRRYGGAKIQFAILKGIVKRVKTTLAERYMNDCRSDADRSPIDKILGEGSCHEDRNWQHAIFV